MMERRKIVILDGFAANPGDLSWEEIEAMGDCRIYVRCNSEAEIVERASDAEIILTNKSVISRRVMEQLPKLRFIAVQATGYNVVDLPAAQERGILVSNVPAYSTNSVAQFVFALILELMNRTGKYAKAVADGAWCRCPDFTFSLGQSRELAGMTLGIVGFGAIGSAAAGIAAAFGMKVLAFTRTPKESSQACFVPLETLFAESDIVSLHCPLTEATRELVNAGTLSQMKKTAFLINTARGGLVEEHALTAALNEERIAGAGLDVLSVEPPPPDNPLLTAKNCIITPHIAWASLEARRRLIAACASNVRAYLSGKPVNLVTR